MKPKILNLLINLSFAFIYPLFFGLIEYAISKENVFFDVRIWLISYLAALIIYRITLAIEKSFYVSDIIFVVIGMISYIVSIILSSIEYINKTSLNATMLLVIIFSILLTVYILLIDKISDKFNLQAKVNSDRDYVKNLLKGDK